MADTGCQSCLASMNVDRRLGLCEGDLIPVTICMHAANNNGIKIIGVVILRFSGQSTSRQSLQTCQIVYVTHDSDKLFLSQEACTALGLISSALPTFGESPCPTTTPRQPLQQNFIHQHNPNPPTNHPFHPVVACIAEHHHLNQHTSHFQPLKTTDNNGYLITTSQAHSTPVSINHYL